MISNPEPEPAHNRSVITTYRYLRAAMIALLLLLVLSPVYQAIFDSAGSTGDRCLLGSISAYYFTPARTVFVGSLFALGACLIAYNGHPREQDVLLNFSGFLAFVVAIVPTSPDLGCGTNLYSQTIEEIETAVRNNFTVLLAVTAIGIIVLSCLRRRKELQGGAKPARSLLVTIIWITAVGIVTAEVLLFVVQPSRFIAVSHGLAAVAMVIGVIGVMILTALTTKDRFQRRDDADSKSQSVEVTDAKAAKAQVPQTPAAAAAALLGTPLRRYQTTYMSIAVVLAASLVLTVAIWGLTGFAQFIFWVELIVIVCFMVFWIVQTIELRNLTEPPPPEPAAEAAAGAGDQAVTADETVSRLPVKAD